jgi:cytochrome c-L
MLGNKTLKSTLVGGLLTIAGLAFSFQANAACNLISTIDGTPLNIKATAEDSEYAKTFLETCKNPYTKITIDAHKTWSELKDKSGRSPEETKKFLAAKKVYYKARREYNYNNCTGCHGGKLEGVMAPGLKKQPEGGQSQWDNMWVYPKNATDKGMFETIAGGTPGKSAKGTMFKWHQQIEGHTGDGLTTDSILKAIAYIRAHYEGKDEKTWLK